MDLMILCCFIIVGFKNVPADNVGSCHVACCVVAALSGLHLRQSYVTEIVSREVSCSARMFSVFLLSLVNQNPARMQAFPAEYCTVAR